MPRSHVCFSCGLDLAPVRAVPDPHYALPVVVCPRCETASVRRRRDPVIQGYRAATRLTKSTSVLGLQALLTLVLLLGYGFTIFGLENLAQDLKVAPARLPIALIEGIDLTRWGARDRLAVLGASLVTTAAAGGAWLTAGFTHLRPRTPWIVWGCILTFFSFIYPAVASLDTLVERLTGGQANYRSPEPAELLFRALFILLWLALAFGVGRPLGRIVRGALAGICAGGWRRAYRARHKRRRTDA